MKKRGSIINGEEMSVWDLNKGTYWEEAYEGIVITERCEKFQT